MTAAEFTGVRDVPLGALTRFPGNARRGDVTAIRASVRRNGQYRALVVRDTGSELTILAGNHTFEALQGEGYETARCEILRCDDAAARRINLSDNRTAELGGYDDDALVELLSYLDGDYDGTGWTEEDVSALIEPPEPPGGHGDPDEVPEPPAEPVSTVGDLYLLGPHRLLCGDATSATDHERLLAGADRLPLAMTSFPYGVGLDYGETYKDDLDSLRKLLAEVPPLVHAALGDGGYFVTNFADIVSAMGILGTDEPCEYPVALDYWPAFRNAGFMLQSRRVWAKPHARVSAPWTSNSNRAACDWEHIWTWKKPGRGLNERRDPSYFGVWDSTHIEGVDIGKDTHPAAFPVGIATLIIRVYSDPGDTVFDPFMGTGTTLIAAHAENRIAYGTEISPTYTDIICKRWETYSGIKPERVLPDGTTEPVTFT